ncbi:MAG: RnfABCDGE type electron transport complex subunit D [Candidatus Marinimicrobia bacterium]|nr:RnfABCDGE type electron transport complex subunit D [Candidatus Neomarinimicrobiota bacterium]
MAKKNSEEQRFTLSSSPHLSKEDDVNKIMNTVIMALVPAIAFSVYHFGWDSLLTIMVAAGSCLATEYLIKKMRKREVTDTSSLLTGILLAMTLPPGLGIGFVMLGSVFAIAIGKEIFGGLGYNIFNPALLGRAFLQASFPVKMTTWEAPQHLAMDAKSFATPLGGYKFGESVIQNAGDYIDGLIMGNVGGCIGETSAIAIILGGVFILVKKYADWRIPVSYLGTVFVLGGIFWLISPANYPDPIFHLFSGGLMIGAFFMATDMVTSPVTPLGSWIFGIGAGVIVILIRLFGGLPEGVMYSIIFMNAFVPLIDRYTRPKYFGEVKK